MRHEKQIKREDGSKIIIEASVWVDGYKGAVYNLSLQVCDKGKRKFRRISKDDYQHRALSMSDREKDMYNEYLKYATEDELQNTKLELWEKLRP